MCHSSFLNQAQAALLQLVSSSSQVSLWLAESEQPEARVGSFAVLVTDLLAKEVEFGKDLGEMWKPLWRCLMLFMSGEGFMRVCLLLVESVSELDSNG